MDCTLEGHLLYTFAFGVQGALANRQQVSPLRFASVEMTTIHLEVLGSKEPRTETEKGGSA